MQVINAMGLKAGKKAEYNRMGSITQPLQFLSKEYKDKPVSPFENTIDKDEFVGLFAAIEMEGLEEKENEISVG